MRTTEKTFRIAVVGHKCIPSREGGVEIVVEALSTRMVRAGHRVTCYNRSGFFPSQITREDRSYQGIRLKTVPTIHHKGLSAVSACFFASLCAAFGPYDIVHFHAEGSCALLWLPKLLGKRCIATIHGLDWQREKWQYGFASRYIKFGEWMAAKYADEIIVLSRHAQVYFRQTYGRETSFLPNATASPHPREDTLLRARFSVKAGEYILFVGRIVPEKGIRCLLEAFRQVNTDKKLVIAGGPSDTEAFLAEMEALAQSDERILFTGFVSGPLLEALYSNAYLYVLPSQLEGMPLSLLEALSYGNCCLTSDIPECMEVLQGHSPTFRMGDPEDLRSKLQMLCDSEDCVCGFRAEAAELISQNHSWDSITEQTLRLYGKKAAGT